MDRLATYRRDLQGLAGDARLRSLAERRGIDFSSNDYLGLAQSDRMRAAVVRALDVGVPVGAAGSRLLRGNTDRQAGFEDAAARFFGS